MVKITKDSNDIAEFVYENPYMFTGKRYDSETGNYYYRARYYSARLGRFLQTDPIGYTDGLNLYTYVHNNPTNFTDPNGLFGTVCGSKDSPIPPSWIPDDTGFLGGADFTSACEWHDNCYACNPVKSHKNKTKAKCDDIFELRMQIACDNAYGSSLFGGLPNYYKLAKCYKIASIYAKAVRKSKGAEKAFLKSRGHKSACCCTKELK